MEQRWDTPPQNLRYYLPTVSWLLDTRKDTIEKRVSILFLVWKGLSIDDVEVSRCRGVERDTVLRERRPIESWF